MQRLERTERLMVRWMCSVSLKDRIPSKELNRYLGVWSVTDVVRRGRLRWFCHLKQKGVNNWVSVCRDMEVTGDRSRDRGRKTWGECVDGEMRLLCLRREGAQDRVRWMGLISGNHPTRASMETRTLNR